METHLRKYGMNQQQLIDLATKHGLIILTEDFPKTNPNHQRLLSKLEKFAEEVYDEGFSAGAQDAIEKEQG